MWDEVFKGTSLKTLLARIVASERLPSDVAHQAETSNNFERGVGGGLGATYIETKVGQLELDRLARTEALTKLVGHVQQKYV